ncbi:MAG: dUTP diphosphatase [Chlamydiota bacterium]
MIEEVNIEIIAEDKATIPVYTSSQASGADISAALSTKLEIAPGASALIPTGLRLAIPEGYEIQVRPRSGLALRHQVTVLNTPGTIDADYRGELKVILINHGQQPFVVEPGMRIAQLILVSVARAHFVYAKELAVTSRAEGGFGHTGL